MTSSSPGQQQPDNSVKTNSPGNSRESWGRFLSRLVPKGIKEEIKRQIRGEVKEALGTQAEQKLQEAINDKIDKELNNIVDKFTRETVKSKQQYLDKEIEKQIGDSKDKITQAKERVDRNVGKQLKFQQHVLRSYKNAEDQLFKIRALAIAIPSIIAAAGFIVSLDGTFQDIRSIKVLNQKIESLEEHVNSSSQSQEQVSCLPGEQGLCCPHGGVFPDCY
ncbi:MAG: hypothetical protein F4X50_09395 [Synechococcus sp. SB0662_bin_14]|nr:hypothetical protein [Synechococcus sp. SB0662_bin_14]